MIVGSEVSAVMMIKRSRKGRGLAGARGHLLATMWSALCVCIYALSLTPTNRAHAAPPQPSMWEGRLRWLERQPEVKANLIEAMFESGPPREVLRAIAQRRWVGGASLAQSAARDPRPRVRHQAYFALSQLAEISSESWASPLLLEARQVRSADRVAALSALGASLKPGALTILARHLDLRLNIKELNALLISLWSWGRRGHFVSLTRTQAKRILDPSFKGSTRSWGVRLAALYLEHERSRGALSAAGDLINHELTNIALAPLTSDEATELAIIALSAARSPELSQQVMQWWGLGQQVRSFTDSAPHAAVLRRARLRLASAHLVSLEPTLKLTPIILTRLTHQLTELAREVERAYQRRERKRAVADREREMGATPPPTPIAQRHEPLIPSQSARAYLLGLELSAHERLIRALLKLKRPDRELIRAARLGVRMTHKWGAFASDLERRASLSEFEPLPFMSAIELARLRCHFSALVDLRRHRASSLKRCGEALEASGHHADVDAAALKPLIGDLTTRVMREAITHHKLRDLEQLRAELPRVHLMELMRGVKLTRRRRERVLKTLKALFAEHLQGSSSGRAYEELHPLIDWVAERRLSELAPTLCKTLKRALEASDLYTGRVTLDALGALRSDHCGSILRPLTRSPYPVVRGAARRAMSLINPDPTPALEVAQAPRRGSFDQRRAAWAAPPPCRRVRFSFTYGEVSARVTPSSLYGARALCKLARSYTQRRDPKHERARVDLAWDGVISLRLPLSVSWSERALDKLLDQPQSERRLISASQLESDRWWITLAGGDLDELEERFMFVRGPLGPPFDEHSVIAEVTSGEETLERLSIGDALSSLVRLREP